MDILIAEIEHDLNNTTANLDDFVNASLMFYQHNKIKLLIVKLTSSLKVLNQE